MAVSRSSKMRLSGLGRRLVSEGLLSEEAAVEAYQGAMKKRQTMVAYLMERELLKARDVAYIASKQFSMPLFNLEAMDIDPEIVKLLKKDILKRHHLLPLFKRGNRLFVGISDPTNLQALDEVKFATGLAVEPVLVEEDKLVHSLDDALDAVDALFKDLDEDDLENLDNLTIAEEEEEDDEVDVEDAPVVRFINKVMLDAIKKGASDLHFEPYERLYRVRFRVDGVLREMAKPPQILSAKIAARLKVMSRLNVSERRVPQDGRIKLKLSNKKSIDFRVSTCPTLFGEKCVLRLLDSDMSKLQIEQLGYEEIQKETFLKNLIKPYGMFLVTGPTGSGKTVSLYTGLGILNKVEVNISTAEDPVEINMSGINQVHIDERTGMTFSKALRAFLRQDPDIILVGEIRDQETGNIAIKAAQTGHMVMSTLHTNDAPQTLMRLKDMGLPPFAVATSINIISAQRLARRLHADYRVASDLPTEQLLEEGFTEQDVEEGVDIYEPGVGQDCPSGYKGRVGIYQVMPISDETRRLILESANAMQLSEQADKEGITDLRRSGLLKVKAGVTSISEINRITLE